MFKASRLVVIVLLFSGLHSAAGLSPIDKFVLWTSGTQLRGANVTQRLVVPELDGPEFMGNGYTGPPYTQTDFDRLAALGANYVNISGAGIFSERPPYAVDKAALAELDHLLTMIANANMYAVIAFRTGPGRSAFTLFREGAGDWFDASYLVENVWTEAAAQDAWAAMWRYTAEHYRDNPIVVGYELMVEPNSAGALLNLYTPQAFYPAYSGTLYDWNQFYPRIVSAIREVDALTPILVGAMGWSDPDWLPYLRVVNDPRIVYVIHQYAPQAQYTHQAPTYLVNSYPGSYDVNYDGLPETIDYNWLNARLQVVDDFRAQHGVPVAVTEFGVMRWEPNAADFIRDELQIFEQRGLNHAIWLWNSSWSPYSSVVDEFDFRHGADPNQHADVPTSALLSVLQDNWQGNSAHPFPSGGRVGRGLRPNQQKAPPGVNGAHSCAVCWMVVVEFS